MIYEMKFCDDECGVTITAERKTLRESVDFIKKSFLNTNNYDLSMCTFKMTRSTKDGKCKEVLYDGVADKLEDLVAFATGD